MTDLSCDHQAGAGSELTVGTGRLEHLNGTADGAERTAQLVSQHRQELVFRAVVVFGAFALAVGLEQLAETGNDQVQAIAIRRDGCRERQTHIDGD